MRVKTLLAGRQALDGFDYLDIRNKIAAFIKQSAIFFFVGAQFIVPIFIYKISIF